MPWSSQRRTSVFSGGSIPTLQSGPSGFGTGGFGGGSGGGSSVGVSDKSLDEFVTGPFIPAPQGANTAGTSSLQRAFPERIGGNLLESPGMEPGLVEHAITGIGRVGAQPIALADTIMGGALNRAATDIDEGIPVIGDILGWGGEAVHNIFTLPAAIMNSAPSRVMAAIWNKGDDTVITPDFLAANGLPAPMADQFKKNGLPVLGWLGITGDQMTIGDLKHELEGRGFLRAEGDPSSTLTWEEFAAQVNGDPLGTYKQGHASVNESAVADFALQTLWQGVETLPLSLGFTLMKAGVMGGAGLAARMTGLGAKAVAHADEIDAAAAGFGTIARASGVTTPVWQFTLKKGARALGEVGDGAVTQMAKDGVIDAAALGVEQGAAQLAAGSARGATLKAFGHYAKSVLYPNIPKLNPLGRYMVGQTNVRLASLAAEGASSALENVIAGPDGTNVPMISDIHDFFESVNNDTIVSDDMVFQTVLAFNMPVTHAFKPAAKLVSAPVRNYLKASREHIIERALVGLENDLGKGTIEKLGGREAAGVWMDKMAQTLAFEKTMRGLPTGVKTAWESLPEASLRMRLIHNTVLAKSQFMIRKGQITASDIVGKFREVHENPIRTHYNPDGTMFRAPALPFRTRLSSDAIIRRANAYTAASAGLADPIIGMRTAVLGRAPRMAKEDLEFTIQTLEDSAVNGQVDAQFIRDLFYETPGMLDDPFVSEAAHNFFVEAMNPAKNEAYDVATVVARLKELDPPSRDQLWHELSMRDRSAPTEPPIGDNGPVSNGVARNIHSEETAKRFALEADGRVKSLKKQRASLMETYRSMFSRRGRYKPSASDHNWEAAAPAIAQEMAVSQVGHFSAVSGRSRNYRRGFDVPARRIGVIPEGDPVGMVEAARAVRKAYPSADVRLTPSATHPGHLDVTGSYHFTNEAQALAKAEELGAPVIFDASKKIEPRVPANPVTLVPKPVLDAKITEITTAMPNLTPEQAAASGELLRTMAQTHVRYNGGSPIDYLNNLEFVRGGRRGAGALRQIELALQPAKPNEIAKRLRYHEAIAAGEGLPVEPAQLVGGGTHAVGRVTKEQWLQMVDTVLTKAEAETARNWYHDLNATFEQMFGSEGNKMLAGFLMSQQRVSPSQGFRSVLMALDELVSGVPGHPTLGGSLAHKRIRAAVKGGFDALTGSDKIWDFADSGAGKLTRSYMGDQGGLQPAAIDVWAARDIGWVDDSVSKAFGVEKNMSLSNSTLNDFQYEAGVKFYNDMAAYLSEKKYLGHTDWTAPQAQALGWVRVQKAMGDIPEGISEIMGRNAAKLASELSGDTVQAASALIGSVSVVERGRHLEVVASPDSVRNMVDTLAFETKQNITAVHGRHASPGGTRQHVVEIKADFDRVRADLESILPDGYTIQEIDGGAIVFGPEGTKTIPNKIRKQIDQQFAEKEFYYAEVARSTHDFQADPTGSAILNSIRERGRADVADALAAGEGRGGQARVFQQRGETGVTKGSIEWDARQKAIIRGYQSADISTFVHEMGHQIRRELVPEDQAIIEYHYGVSEGKWARKHEERFARDFERYLLDGRAPTDVLRDAFSKIATWMREIYKTLKGTPLENKIAPEVREIFDRALGKVDENAAIRLPGKSALPEAEPIMFTKTDHMALMAEREAMRQAVRDVDAQIARTQADIREVRARAKELKKGMNNLDESFTDVDADGNPKVTGSELKKVTQYTNWIRENYPQFEVEAGPRIMNLYEPDTSLLKNLMLENDATGQFLFNWGPFSKMNNAIRSAVDAATRPVRGRIESADTTSRIYEVLMAHGAQADEIKKFLENVREVLANERTFGFAHEQLPITRGVNAMGARQLSHQALKAFAGNDKFISAFEKRYGGNGLERIYVTFAEAYNPVIRNIQRRIERGELGGKRGAALRLMESTYDAYHTAPGFNKLAVGTHALAKFVYPLVRFTLNPLYHVYNATESEIIGITQDGLRVRRGRTAKSAEVFNTVERGNFEANAGRVNQARRMEQYGMDPALDAYTDELIRNATLDQTGVPFGYNSRRAAIMERQVDLRRPETITDAIRQFTAEDPAIQAAIKRYGGNVDDWVEGLTQDIYGIDSVGARKYIADLIKQEGWTKQELLEMQPLISEVTNRMQGTFDDIYQLHVGNASRSRIERVLNSYWLFWPASYMLKANKWMFKVLTEGAFGRKTNAGGAWALNELSNEYHERYVRDSNFRKLVDDNDDLLFMLSSILPVAPWSDGVSLNRLTRYVGGHVGLWPQYTNFDPVNVTEWGSKMGQIGPAYSLALGGDVLKGLAKTVDWNLDLGNPAQEAPVNPQAVPGL